MRETVALIFMSGGLFFIGFGILGLYRFKNFYTRILIASNVDTAGFILLLAGVIIKHGFSFFSLKVSFIVGLVLIVNPLITHAITRSAYNSGFKIKKE